MGEAMAFVKVDKSNRSYSLDNIPAVTMAAHLAEGKFHKGRSVSFRVSRALVDQLGWKATDGRIRIGVFEGTDKDVGFLQLMVDPEGYSAALGEPGSKQGIGINVTIERFKHYVLNDCPVASMTVNFIAEKDTLVVECPDWLRFNPLSVPQQEAPPPRPIQPARQGVKEIAKAVAKEELTNTNRKQRRAIVSAVARALQ